MPTHKDLKRLVRRRMQKTGESYTAARAQLVKARIAKRSAGSDVKRARNGATPSAPPAAGATKPAPARARTPAARGRTPAASKAAATPLPPVAEFPKLAGMSDAAIRLKTGCDWRRWVGALDHVQAHTWPHRKIAEYVQQKFGIADWWAQTVTVGYERIRGLREIGQRRGGAYEATKSRTFAVAVEDLFDAFAQGGRRARWLAGVALEVRRATPHRSVRMSWPDGSSVSVWLVAKGAGKSSAQVQHAKLPDRATADRMRAFWTERLEALGELLG
jgi:hypothetical protein